MGCTLDKPVIVVDPLSNQVSGNNQDSIEQGLGRTLLSGDTNPSFHGNKEESGSGSTSSNQTTKPLKCAGDADSNDGTSSFGNSNQSSSVEPTNEEHTANPSTAPHNHSTSTPTIEEPTSTTPTLETKPTATTTKTNARSILPPMEDELAGRDPMALRPSTAKKGFVTFDVILDDNVEATTLDDLNRKPPPKRLMQRLEPLENAPKLTSEMLTEKLERANEKRRKNLASRQSRRPKTQSSSAGSHSDSNNSVTGASNTCDAADILDCNDEGDLQQVFAATKSTLDDLADFCQLDKGSPGAKRTPKEATVASGDRLIVDRSCNNVSGNEEEEGFEGSSENTQCDANNNAVTVTRRPEIAMATSAVSAQRLAHAYLASSGASREVAPSKQQHNHQRLEQQHYRGQPMRNEVNDECKKAIADEVVDEYINTPEKSSGLMTAINTTTSLSSPNKLLRLPTRSTASFNSGLTAKRCLKLHSVPEDREE